MKHIAIGPHGWGKADSVDVAIINCISNIPMVYCPDKVSITVYDVHDEAYVDGLGGICGPASQKPVKNQTIIVPRKHIEQYNEALDRIISAEDITYYDENGKPEE